MHTLTIIIILYYVIAEVTSSPLCRILLVRNRSQVTAAFKGVNARTGGFRGRSTSWPTYVCRCVVCVTCASWVGLETPASQVHLQEMTGGRAQGVCGERGQVDAAASFRHRGVFLSMGHSPHDSCLNARRKARDSHLPRGARGSRGTSPYTLGLWLGVSLAAAATGIHRPVLTHGLGSRPWVPSQTMVMCPSLPCNY